MKHDSFLFINYYIIKFELFLVLHFQIIGKGSEHGIQFGKENLDNTIHIIFKILYLLVITIFKQ